MLKATLKAKENIDIEKFGAVIPYLKKLNVGYRCKKIQRLDTRRNQKIFGTSGRCRIFICEGNK
jgi:hypothetical protein